MANVIVLGVGMVGRVMTLDLARRHRVVACDRDRQALARLEQDAEAAGLPSPPKSRELDVGAPSAVEAAARGFDLAVVALPGFLGLGTLRAVIGTGMPVADISFGPEDVLDLDGLARARGSCAVVDIGVAPGLSSLLLGHHDRDWRLEEYECLVGGLPEMRRRPWQYKAPFSPTDVVEEYVRPARQMEDGRIVVHPALSQPELIDFPGIGILEAFNTDGLRSILRTMGHVPNMREKTLRWPGHRELAHALQETGLLSDEPVAVTTATGETVDVSPREVTSRLLFSEWALEPGEPEFTAMRVMLRGTARKDGAPRQAVYHLLDRTDPATGATSMARTTGYTCVAAAEFILSGAFGVPGVHPGERLGAIPGALDHVLAFLAERGVHLDVAVTPADPAQPEDPPLPVG